ncbi:cupin domain-containing protein [Chloroflexi bacterium CFX2]|nr:cupin domain-containing protein [Chloroflexi bacterium CFX2]
MDIDTVQRKEKCDYLAPDGSEIFLLANGSKGSLCQCILPVGAVSEAISHKTVEELWFIIEGQGEVFRKGINKDEPVAVNSGTSLVIPSQTTFQFRNTGDVPLRFMITTIPPWPGPDEAIKVKGKW